MSNPIHQEVAFKASPQQVYGVLTDARQFSKATGGAPTEISSEPGGSFSCFGGMIVGRNLELIPNQRIVQAWRAGNWEPGIFSIVKFEFKEQNGQTRLVFDHTGFPEDNRKHLDAGWVANYWEPLKKYLDQRD
jgi:activator of HSP90 ATPase